MYCLPFLSALFLQGQVGINTQTPQTTLEVIGKPNDPNHYDGIIPPRITGDQLAQKNIQIYKKGQLFM